MTATTAPQPDRAPTARTVQAGETRRRLIAAAVEIFSERSFDDVNVGDIAKAAGAAHGLVFHYFGSKRGIYAEALREVSGQLDALFAPQPDMTPEQQLRSSLAAHLHYLADHRGLALRLALGGRGTDPQAWEVFEAGRWRIMSRISTMFGLDPANAALAMAMRAATGFIDEATVYWLTHDEPYGIEAMVDYLVEIVAAAVRSATALDPDLDVSPAADVLRRSRRS